MNAGNHSRLNDLYRGYVSCVDEKLKAFISAKPAAETNVSADAKEWCSSEKNQYFSFMQ